MTAAAFKDPALGAQAAFRALLDALARPGTPQAMGPDLPTPPTGMGAGLYAAILALADFETTVWLAPELADAAADLRFQLGARLVAAPAEPAFALAADGAALPPLAAFAQGDDAYPDRSTTLLVEVSALRTDGGWRLTGPGIASESRLGVAGLPADFVAQWTENHARFPRGIDLFLFHDTTVVSLPRTTDIRED
ncbi:MAG: phosphonate C-P lyase system protein PhnH [Alphaproteobacteria bacterium]|jgi:alpha-D-ribose 1-methylphosphonate 5-triphosphate synthase subunit PhnH|nr:phosphonate C-P lyase system protein PhnH [Alphaproteobacteria bacterium]